MTRDYSATLFLPKTDFPMRAGLPRKEPELLARWLRLDLYRRLREAANGRAKFILHDGPPYANGNVHSFDANYVPGWDCHGLPIEWKIEEEYRAKGKNKDAVPIVEFRRECRAFAEHWIDVQREEFKRLGVEGDWAHPYTTMSFDAEAQIARELMKFVANATLYRGSKPVMWSVVEKTALAEAEVEYEDYTSDTVWVAFPIISSNAEALRDRKDARVVIWTTTPWTLPGNRAIAYSKKLNYVLLTPGLDLPPPQNLEEAAAITGITPEQYETGRNEINAARKAFVEKYGNVSYLVAARLYREFLIAVRFGPLVFDKVEIGGALLEGTVCAHPLRGKGYDFDVPLLDGDHVSDDAGTGFVHTAPGHGREDFEIWSANEAQLKARGINTAIPFTVDADGRFTSDAPGFVGKRVLTEAGEKGDANDAVIAALVDAGMLIARGKLKHQYPHSWRSKKPVIFRNTPQWFIAMDRDIAGQGDTLRARALAAIEATRWVPEQGRNRMTGMIVSRPDWVISRQRAWGVPITLFVREERDGSVEILRDDKVNARIFAAFEREGADAWYADGAAARFLSPEYDAKDWTKVDDILDVWFDSGSTHAFVLEVREDLKPRRHKDGGPDTVLYLEGSDQHRGWFQSSLLESCGTRGVAPFDIVVTHGFTLDEAGRKMSKSLGNTVAPQDVIAQSGADILRLWVGSVDYWDDQRIGPEVLKTTVDTYRKLRNTIRWMLGNLAHFRDDDRIAFEAMPELERLMLHRLSELDALVREAYAAFDYKRIFASLNAFMTVDLSAFYFDVRKDALYCDPISSVTRKACLNVLEHLFRWTVSWLAPILCFTAEEAWLCRYPSAEGSVHLELFPKMPAQWRDDRLAEKWRKVRLLRRVVTGALEIERAAKRIGSSLEAAPVVYVTDRALLSALDGVDLGEVAITSAASLVAGEGPPDAFRLEDVPGVAVEPRRAEGSKCARSWKILPSVGCDPEYPDVSPRDAQALREWEAMRKAAE